MLVGPLLMGTHEISFIGGCMFASQEDSCDSSSDEDGCESLSGLSHNRVQVDTLPVSCSDDA